MKIRHKTLLLGFFFLLIGVIFLYLENTLYQYVDKEGVLHESLFLPLGVFALIIGSILLFLLMVKKVVELLFSNRA